MSVKGKLVKYSLAAAIVSTSFAGIPFSEKGLAQHLAAQTAYAAAVSSTETAIARYNAVYAKLDTQGQADVEAARLAIKNLSGSQRDAIAGPIADKLNVSDTDRAVLANLVVDLLSVPAVLSVDSFNNIVSNPDYRATLKSVAADANVDVQGLKIEDVAETAVAIEASVKSQLEVKTLSELLALATDTAKQKEFFADAVDSALAIAGTNAQKLRDLATAYDIKASDLVQALSALRAEVGANKFDKARNAIALAYVATLNANTPSTTSPGSGTVLSGLDQQLDNLTKQLADATDAEKSKLVEQAVDFFLDAIKGADSLSVQTTVVDGKVTADPSQAVVAKLDAVIAAAAKLQSFLTAAKSDASIPVKAFNVDLGTVESQSIGFKLSEEAMKKLNASPFSSLNVIVNGLTLEVPNNAEFGKSLELSIGIEDSAIEGYNTVSSVYSFELTLGGKAVTEFTNPLVLHIPLGNLDGVDKELLSVAKIVDGKLQFQGGVLNGNTIVEPRDTFSSYVVVENKVSFSDIASVQAWAGRQIEVLAAKGAISGRSDKVFDPKGNVTRAEFAKMLIRALNLESANLTSDFSDVKSTDWFAPYVAAAAKKGIINGRSADKFAPNATITRAEMATMIARALRLTSTVGDVKDVNAALSKFSDAGSIHASLKDGVALAASQNIIIGDNGKFNPNNNATRAEAAVILYRTLQVK